MGAEKFAQAQLFSVANIFYVRRYISTGKKSKAIMDIVISPACNVYMIYDIIITNRDISHDLRTLPPLFVL